MNYILRGNNNEMNELEFTLSEKDLLAFFEYHAGNSPTFQRNRRSIVLLSSVIIATLALGVASLLHEFLVALLGIILAIATGLHFHLREFCLGHYRSQGLDHQQQL